MTGSSEFVTPGDENNGFGRLLVQCQLSGIEPGNWVGELREEAREHYVPAHLISATTSHADGTSREQRSDPLKFSDNLETSVTSPWLRTELARYATGSILDAIVASDDEGLIVPDPLAMNVIQAHNFYLAERSRELRPQVNELIEEFEDRLYELIESGALPEAAARNLYALDAVRFSVGDNYLAREKTLGSCHWAHDIEDADDVIVSMPELQDGVINKDTFFHELFHVIAKPQATNNLESLLNGLVYKDRLEGVSDGLTEALTEHLTQVLLGKREMEDVVLGWSGEVYFNERAFLLALKTASEGEFSIQQLVDQFFAYTPGSNTRRQLRMLLDDPDFVDPGVYFALTDL